MNQVSEWLQKIITTIILAGFIEMLLPSNEFKNVTRMIIGLFIIMILIQPLVKLIDLPHTIAWSLPNLTINHTRYSTGEIIQEGAKLRQSWLHQFTKDRQTVIKQKIENLIGLIDGVQLEDISLQTHKEELSKVILKVKYTSGRYLDPEIKSQIANKLYNSVQLITNLTQEQIEVVWSG